MGGQGSDTHVTVGDVPGFGLITRRGHAHAGELGQWIVRFICPVPSFSFGGVEGGRVGEGLAS